MRYAWLALPLLFQACGAWADDPDFCVDRPGLGTPACTLKSGRAMIEVAPIAWDHSSDTETVEDDLTYGQALLRYGLDDKTEFQLGLNGYGTVRLRDRTSGGLTRGKGFGDTTLALRRSISGSGGPVALQAFVTLPTGSNGIGAGDWGAGLLVPIAIDLPANFELDLTPELDAAVNLSGAGRHFAWGGVVGLSHPLASDSTASAEVGARRDMEPASHTTFVRFAVSLAWQVASDVQIDFEGDLGLSADAPRHSLLVGLARRF